MYRMSNGFLMVWYGEMSVARRDAEKCGKKWLFGLAEGVWMYWVVCVQGWAVWDALTGFGAYRYQELSPALSCIVKSRVSASQWVDMVRPKPSRNGLTWNVGWRSVA